MAEADSSFACELVPYAVEPDDPAAIFATHLCALRRSTRSLRVILAQVKGIATGRRRRHGSERVRPVISVRPTFQSTFGPVPSLTARTFRALLMWMLPSILGLAELASAIKGSYPNGPKIDATCDRPGSGPNKRIKEVFRCRALRVDSTTPDFSRSDP